MLLAVSLLADNYYQSDSLVQHNVEITQEYTPSPYNYQVPEAQPEQEGTMHDYRYPVTNYSYDLAPTD